MPNTRRADTPWWLAWYRSRVHFHVPDDNSGRHRPSGPAGIRARPIGLGADADSPDGIPVTNLSVNPARSTGPALFVGGWALQQLWLFWLAPIVGAAIAGVVYPVVAGESEGLQVAAVSELVSK